jgi:hypothetical protein
MDQSPSHVTQPPAGTPESRSVRGPVKVYELSFFAPSCSTAKRSEPFRQEMDLDPIVDRIRVFGSNEIAGSIP